MKQKRPSQPLWRNREYRLWFTGDLALEAGISIGSFAFPLIALAVTGSLELAGTVAFFQALGLILGILPGGVLADRYDRKKLRLISCTLGLLAQSAFVALLLTNTATVATLAALALLDRLRSALLGGASDAMIKQVVEADDLPRAIAINQGRDAAVGLGGGPAGGALLTLGVVFPPLAQLTGNLLALVSTLGMRGNYLPSPDAHKESFARDFLTGARWMLGRPTLLVLATAIALLNFGINGAIMTVTLRAADAGTNPALIGGLLTALSAAMLLGSFFAGKAVETLPVGWLVLGSFILFAGLTLILPLLPNLLWVGGALALAGLLVPTINAGLMGFFTLVVPDHMLGRVQSLVIIFTTGLASLAPAVAGWALGYLNESVAVGIFAGTCALAAILLALNTTVRALPASPGWQQHAEKYGLL